MDSGWITFSHGMESERSRKLSSSSDFDLHTLQAMVLIVLPPKISSIYVSITVACKPYARNSYCVGMNKENSYMYKYL